MAELRSFLRTCPRLCLWLAVLAFATKLLVPAGHMLAVDDGRIAIVVCPGTVPAPAAMSHGHGDHHEAPSDHGKPELPCAFASLAAPVLDVVDPVLLAVALAAVALLALRRPTRVVAASPLRWRPPLRAPPVAFLTR